MKKNRLFLFLAFFVPLAGAQASQKADQPSGQPEAHPQEEEKHSQKGEPQEETQPQEEEKRKPGLENQEEEKYSQKGEPQEEEQYSQKGEPQEEEKQPQKRADKEEEKSSAVCSKPSNEDDDTSSMMSETTWASSRPGSPRNACPELGDWQYEAYMEPENTQGENEPDKDIGLEDCSKKFLSFIHAAYIDVQADPSPKQETLSWGKKQVLWEELQKSYTDLIAVCSNPQTKLIAKALPIFLESMEKFLPGDLAGVPKSSKENQEKKKMQVASTVVFLEALLSEINNPCAPRDLGKVMLDLENNGLMFVHKERRLDIFIKDGGIYIKLTVFPLKNPIQMLRKRHNMCSFTWEKIRIVQQEYRDCVKPWMDCAELHTMLKDLESCNPLYKYLSVMRNWRKKYELVWKNSYIKKPSEQDQSALNTLSKQPFDTTWGIALHEVIKSAFSSERLRGLKEVEKSTQGQNKVIADNLLTNLAALNNKFVEYMKKFHIARKAFGEDQTYRLIGSLVEIGSLEKTKTITQPFNVYYSATVNEFLGVFPYKPTSRDGEMPYIYNLGLIRPIAERQGTTTVNEVMGCLNEAQENNQGQGKNPEKNLYSEHLDQRFITSLIENLHNLKKLARFTNMSISENNFKDMTIGHRAFFDRNLNKVIARVHQSIHSKDPEKANEPNSSQPWNLERDFDWVISKAADTMGSKMFARAISNTIASIKEDEKAKQLIQQDESAQSTDALEERTKKLLELENAKQKKVRETLHLAPMAASFRTKAQQKSLDWTKSKDGYQESTLLLMQNEILFLKELASCDPKILIDSLDQKDPLRLAYSTPHTDSFPSITDRYTRIIKICDQALDQHIRPMNNLQKHRPNPFFGCIDKESSVIQKELSEKKELILFHLYFSEEKNQAIEEMQELKRKMAE
jgi:hypothetical protein